MGNPIEKRCLHIVLQKKLRSKEMTINRIEQVLERIGLTNLPKDKPVNIEHSGLDSLMLALLIIELENEFKVKIPVIPLEKEHFESINSIKEYLSELGAK